MQRWRETILSQYGNSPSLLSIIESFDAAQDPAGLIDEFYENVWNIETATGNGLDIWGRIVGVSRVLALDATDYWGFKTPLRSYKPLGHGPLYQGPSATSNYRLGDVAFRNLIMVKALANISNSSTKSLNALLRKLYSGQKVYCLDLGDMALRVVFEFLPKPYGRAIFIQSGVFPRPAGVRLEYMEVIPSRRFGFRTSGLSYAPLGHGTFYGGTIHAVV